MSFKRETYKTILARLKEPRSTIQVISGPRQVGKTTLIQQVLEAIKIPVHYASADKPGLANTAWIEQQWELARVLANDAKQETILVLDEVQKINHWSDIVKQLWDEDTFEKRQVKVVLLGSSPLLMQVGLTESLAGRFETIPVTHWSFAEMRKAFGWSLNQYVYFGGYPKSAEFIHDENRWRDYINDSLIETSISRDILLMNRVDKPALLRQLFYLGCAYSGQILSYQKILGQLSDAGNTTTLSHYLELLSGAGLLTGLEKYSGKIVNKKSSSPKFIPLNTALISAQNNITFDEARKQREYWGRLVEASIGAYMYNQRFEHRMHVDYWREGNYEIDFVLSDKNRIVAFEVKSGIKPRSLPGIKKFQTHYKSCKPLLIGGQGISLEDFLSKPVAKWV
jgi:hypothetical protein